MNKAIYILAYSLLIIFGVLCPLLLIYLSGIRLLSLLIIGWFILIFFNGNILPYTPKSENTRYKIKLREGTTEDEK